MKKVYEVCWYSRVHGRLIPHKELWEAETRQEAINRFKDSVRKQRPPELTYSINVVHVTAYPWTGRPN